MTPGPGAPRGFLTGLMGAIGPKMDRAHEEEQASIKEQRANLWSEIQSVMADARQPTEKQIYKGDHNAIVQEKLAAYLKFLSPATKKKAGPLGQLLQKLVPPKAKGGAPQAQQGTSPQEQVSSPGAQPGAQPPGVFPGQYKPPAAPPAGIFPNRQHQPDPEAQKRMGGVQLAAPAAQQQVSQTQPQPATQHGNPSPLYTPMFTQEEQTQRQQAAAKFRTDEEIRKEEATSADRLKLQEERDKAQRELQEMKDKQAEELAKLKGADAKTLEDTKAAHAKEIETLKAQHAKELAEAKAAAKPAAVAKKAGTTVADQVDKKYVPGGKSIANPTGNLTIDVGAWDYIATTHLPFTGFGSGAAKGQKNARELMLGRAGELLADLGLTPADLPAIRGKIKADTGALGRVTSMGALIQQFEGTLDRNMQVAQKLSDAWQRSDLQFVNRISGAFKTGTGDSEALNLAAQLHGVAREWGKIMQGSVSAAGVQVSEANATDLLFSKGISNGQLASFMQSVVIPDIKNRTSAIEGEKAQLVASLRSDIAGTATPQRQPSPNGTLTPPASGGAGAPKKGDKQQYNGAGYTFDGTQWVKDKK